MISDFVRPMSSRMVNIWLMEYGTRRSPTKKAPMLMSMATTVMGASTLVREMPLAFMAVSSKCSPMSPRVIMELRRVASGMARGRVWNPPHMRNSSITLRSRPLPTSSSIYSHRNCITRIKVTIARIARNCPTNDLSMN